MSNSIWAMRMLNQLRVQPAVIPLDDGRDERRPRGRRERSRSPSPPARRSEARRSEARRSEKSKPRRARSPSSSSEEISESDYSSYDEAEVIKTRFKNEPCEYVSNAGLADKKTKKEVVNYLEEKQCPKIEKHAKRKHVPKVIAEQQSNPKTVAEPASVAAKSEPAVAPVSNSASSASGNVVVSSGEDKIEKRGKGRPKGPERIKKPPTAYNLAVGKHMKAGKTMKEASQLAREELAKKD
jgi:hypothetical protein